MTKVRRRSNVSEFYLTDRELSALTQLSLKRVSAGKKRLVEIGFMDCETDPAA